MANSRAPAAADVEVDVRALLRALLRALPFILIFAGLAGGGAFYVLSGMAPVYKAQATLLIESGESELTRSATGSGTAAVLDREAVASQVQLIRSGDLARLVIADLDLRNQPEYRKAIEDGSFIGSILARFGLGAPAVETSVDERVLARYYSSLDAYAIAESRVIAVEFSSTDPQLAARGANTVAEAYIALQRAAKRDTTHDATTWLETEIADLRQKVAVAEAQVEEFRAANDLFTSGGQTPTTLTQQQLADLNAELARVRATKADAETKSAQIRASLRSGVVPNITDVLNSPLIQRLVEQQVALRSQIAELSATLLPGHPRMRELAAQLGDLNAQVNAEAQKIVAALEAEAELSLAREREIQGRLEGLKVTAATASDAEVELRALEREAAAQRELLDTYLLRYREAIGRQNADYLPADARIISTATVPIQPDFPKVVPMTAAVTVAALLLAIAFVLVRELASGRPMRPISYEEPLPVVPGAVPVVGHMRWADDHRIRRMMPAEPTLFPQMASKAEQSLIRIAGEIVAGARRRILVTAAGEAGENDRPLAAVALARALARADRRTVLVDLRADGANSDAMGEGSNLPGFTDLFAGEASFAQVIFRDRRSRVHFVPAGRLPLTAGNLSGERMATILGALDHTYDHVIIDAGDDMIEAVAPGAEAAVVVSEYGSSDPRTTGAFDRITAVSSAAILLLMIDPAARATPAVANDAAEAAA